MSNVPDKERFQEAYQGKPPWDISKPQSVFVQAADQITGSVLDVGCGTGENALFFAARGQRVTGIDFLEQPIAEATRKAHQRGLDATFLVMDALRLEDLPEVFDSAIDCGLFHVFSTIFQTWTTSAMLATTPCAWRFGSRLRPMPSCTCCMRSSTPTRDFGKLA